MKCVTLILVLRIQLEGNCSQSSVYISSIRYIESLLDYLYDYSQRVLPLYDVEGVSNCPTCNTSHGQ